MMWVVVVVLVMRTVQFGSGDELLLFKFFFYSMIDDVYFRYICNGPSLQAVRAETMVDGLLRACT